MLKKAHACARVPCDIVRVHLLSLFLLVAPFSSSLFAASLEPVFSPQAVFENSTTTLVFHCASTTSSRGRLSWSVKAGSALIQQGDLVVDLGPEPAVPARIEVQTPPVRDGVVVESTLTVQLRDDSGLVATHQQPLYFFGRDPFVHRRQWLEQLRLTLYDPIGQTQSHLDALSIPYTVLTRPDARVPESPRILIIGEGLSLRDYPGLDRFAIDKAREGMIVIWLSPFAGAFELPWIPTPSHPVEVLLQDSTFLSKWDPRLDGLPVTGRFRPVEDHHPLNWRVDADEGWPWVELRFPGNGRLLLLGFAFIEDWSHGPSARHLFAHLLEYVTTKQEKKP